LAAARWDGSLALGVPGDGISWNDVNNWSVDGTVDIAPADQAPGDNVSFPAGAPSSTINLNNNRTVNSLTFASDQTLVGHTLSLTTGEIAVEEGVKTTFESNIIVGESQLLRKSGSGVLVLTGSAPVTLVEEGTVSGSGTLASLSVLEGGAISTGSDIGTLTI